MKMKRMWGKMNRMNMWAKLEYFYIGVKLEYIAERITYPVIKMDNAFVRMANTA